MKLCTKVNHGGNVRISQVLILALKCHTFTYMCEISYFLSDILNVMQFFYQMALKGKLNTFVMKAGVFI